MAKQLLKERLQELAGIKSLNEQSLSDGDKRALQVVVGEYSTDEILTYLAVLYDQIGFYDKGKAVVPGNVQHRKLDDIKPGGLGTYFIKQIMDNAVFKKDQKGWVNHLVLTKKI